MDGGKDIPSARGTDFLVSFDNRAGPAPWEVSGTVHEMGGNGPQHHFHGWLQLLGILEAVTGHTSPTGDDGRPGDPRDTDLGAPA